MEKKIRNYFVLMALLLTTITVWGQTTIINSTTAGAFEGASFTADGWSVVNAATNRWQMSTNATTGFTGLQCAYISNSATSPFAHTYTMSSGQVSSLYRDVTVPAGETQIQLSFKWICAGEGTAFDRMRIWLVPTSNTPTTTQYATSGSAPTGVIQVGATNYNVQNTWTSANVTIPAAYAGTTFRLVFQWRNDGSGGTNPPIAIDDVSLTSNCTGATTAAATAITSTSATLNATTFAGATGYNFRYRVVSSPTWTLASGNPYASTSAPITGLSANTSYEFQVAATGAVCNAWSSSTTFTTPCNAFSTFPWTESFDNSSTTRACWTAIDGNADTDIWSYGTTIPRTGQSAQLYTDFNTSNQDYLISPQIDLGTTPRRMKFWIRHYSNSEPDNIRVKISTTGKTIANFTTTLLTLSTTQITTTYTEYVVDLSAYTGLVYLAFAREDAPADGWYVAIDDVTFEDLPLCNNPTGLTASSITNTSATVSWTAPTSGTPTGYNWKVVAAGAGSGGTAVASGTTTAPTVSASATGLTANTSYDLWVQTDCGASGTSTWAGPTNFYTGYCLVSTTNTSDYTSAFSTTGALANLSYSASSQPTGSYSNQTAQSFQATAGTVINFSHTYVGGSNGMNIWVDWNNDLDFLDAGENVFTLANTNATKTGSFTIPGGTAVGSYRVRVRSQWGSTANPPSCGNVDYGSTVDYNLQVVTPPACSSPTGLTVTPTSATAADVSWTCTGCTGTYIIEYGAAGFTPGTGATAGTGGTVVTAASSPQSITGLSTATVTDFYVRQDCSGSYSTNSSVVKFIPGDVCANAIDLGTLTSPLSSTTVGANHNVSYACNSNTDPDLIYYIDVPANYTLVIGQTVNGYDSENYLHYGGACPGTTQIACFDDPDVQNITWENTTGATQRVYWVQDGYGSGNSGTFTLAWSLTAPPACGNITLGTTTGITYNSATLNWTAGTPTPTDFEIEYGVSPYTFTGTPTITTTSGALTQLLSSLTASTTYQFKIRSICAGPAMGNWSTTGSFTTLVAPPANDNCAGAITLTGCSGGAQTLSGTTLNSTVDAVYTNCGALGTNTTERGVWYKYVGDDNEVTINTCDAIGYDSRITVYSGSCGTLTCVGANDDMGSTLCSTSGLRSQVVFNAFSGTDYYVFVHGYQTGTSLSATGDFVLNWSCSPLCLPMPINEACASAQSISLTTSYSANSANNKCAAANFTANPSCFSAFATLPDLWYSFTTPAGISAVNLRIDLTAGTGNAATMGYALYSGTCGALTQVACNSSATSGATNILTGLTPATNYYLALASLQADRGAFSYGLWYETCPQPTVLGANTITSSTANLTWTSNAASSNFDIYYGISPLTAPTGSTTPTVNDYNGGAGTAITYAASGLTHTSSYQYYVREDCGGGDASAWSGPYSFTTLAPPPANDNISGAIAVACGSATAGSTVSATLGTDETGTCGTPVTTAGVWYSFVGNGYPTTFDVCGAPYDSKMSIYTGTSGALTCVAGEDDDCGNDPSIIVNTINGTTYLILVHGYLGGTGTFTLNVNCNAPIWTGAVSSDWSTAGNWMNAAIPNSCASDVIIPAGTTNEPIISTTDIQVGNVTIGNGVDVTLQNSHKLMVCGNWSAGTATNATVVGGNTEFNGTGAQTITGNSQFDILTVNNAAGVSMGAGAQVAINTRLAPTTGNFGSNGNLTFLSTSPTHCATIDLTAASTGAVTGSIHTQRYVPVSGNNQHYFSSPINSVALSQYGASGTAGFVVPQVTCDETQLEVGSPYGTLFRYDESHGATCGLAGWEVLTGGNAQNAKGYSVYQNNGTLTLTGAPNQASTITTSGYTNSNWTNTSAQGRSMSGGWALVGNPYLSTINLDGTHPDFDAQAQVWHTSGPFTGTYQPIMMGGGSAFVAPHQGFMVHKTVAGGTAAFDVTRSECVNTTESFYRQTVLQGKLGIKVSGNTFNDYTTVQFNSDATNAFDPMLDADKLNGNLNQPCIYSEANSRRYSINTLQNIVTNPSVPVTFIPGANGTFEFTFDNVSSFDPTTYIYLEDVKTGAAWVNLRNTNTYTFTANVNDAKNRFVLHFTPPVEVTAKDASCAAKGSIELIQPGNSSWNCVVTDAANNTVQQSVLNSSTPVAVNNLTAGNYHITFTDATGYVATKDVTIAGTNPADAVFTNSVNNVAPNTAIDFIPTTIDNSAVYTWNFGDGTSANTAVANHSFAQNGTYNVVLTVTSAGGCVATSSKTVNIVNSTTGVETIENGVTAYCYEDKVYIKLDNKRYENADIMVYNLIGQMILRDKLTTTKWEKTIPVSESSFIVVSLTAKDGSIYSKKLYLIKQ